MYAEVATGICHKNLNNEVENICISHFLCASYLPHGNECIHLDWKSVYQSDETAYLCILTQLV